MLVASLAVTAGAVVVAVGFLPYPGDRDPDRDPAQDRTQAGAPVQAQLLDVPPVTGVEEPAHAPSQRSPSTSDPTTALPRSGQGRRVVYDMSDQRVWLVRGNGAVLDSYLVSGSRFDNLDAGRYEVYSRSVNAIGYTGASTMRHMVRFTYGENASIGFHDIPVDRRGRRVQSVAALGTPRSDGCIRQRPRDAKQLWAFAPVGTSVVVLD